MSRLNQILLVLLAVQSLGFVMSRAFEDDPTDQKTVKFFADLDADKVTAIAIEGAPPSKKDDPPQEKVKLTKVDGKWGISGADDYPVDKTKVDELLTTLGKLKSRNTVLNSSTYHDKLEVAADKFQRKLSITAGDATTVLYVGSAPRFKNVHVRPDGGDEVYLVNDFGTTQLGDRAWSWVSREYINVPNDQVWQVSVKNGKGEVSLERDPVSKQWAVVGLTKPMDDSTVSDFVRKASSVNLESPVGKTVDPSYGLSEPGATITLTTGTSTAAGLPPPTTETLTWKVGKKIGEANQYYVKSEKNAYVVKTAGWALEPLLTKTTADFAKKEEEKK